VRLNNGGYFVVLKTGAAAKAPDGGELIVLFNRLVPEANLFAVPREEFISHWTGDIILLKRVFSLDDTDRRFGLGWLVPEISRQRVLLRNVMIAALAMHVLALAVPIFFQIVIDRVLIYLSLSTLVVISIGVGLAILFDSAFNWLRGYFVLRTASRIDIRVARTTFRHLMSLPISFFETSRAGVATKHMQQGVTIREFLTGKLLTTLLDFPALIIFLPLMAWYSVSLTIVVFW
jgi:subfamily B ATP-binding cassette protein HlyB/CyaB